MNITSSQLTILIAVKLKMTAGILDLSDVSGDTPIYLSATGCSLLAIANATYQYSSNAISGETVLRGQAGKKY